ITVGVLPVPPTVTLPTTTTGTPTFTCLIQPSAKKARRIAAIKPNTQANGVSDHATQPRLRHSRARKFSIGGLKSDMARLVIRNGIRNGIRISSERCARLGRQQRWAV